MLTSDYLIINRKPQRFTVMKIAGKAAVFAGADGRILDHGVLALDGSVYAMLCCDEARNATLVVSSGEIRRVVTILWQTEVGYRQGLERLRAASGRDFSPQNIRINRYAEAIRDKLAIGVRLQVTDAVDTAAMTACPDCGTLNPPGSAFCMECGADLGL